MARTFISNRRRTTALILVGLCLWPAQSLAQLAVMCVNCQNIMQGAQIISGQQMIQSSISQQTSQMQSGHRSIERATNDVEQAVDESASSIVSELDAHLAGVGELTNALAVSIRKSLKQHQAAMAAAKAQQTYGYGSEEYTVDGVVHRPTAQPLTLCGTSARAEMAGASIGNRELVVGSTIAEIYQYNNAYTDVRSSLNRYETLPDTAYDADLILGDDSALTQAEAEQAEEWIKTVTNPMPEPTISDDLQSTVTGQAYVRSRKILQAELSPSQRVLAKLKSDVTMTVPLAAQVRNKWAEIDPNKVIESEDGNVSPLLVLRTEIAYRYASKEWTDRLVDLTQRGALVELLTMRAIEMKMEYERYQLARARTAMMAINSARQARVAAEQDITRQRRIVTGQVPTGS